MAKVYNFADPTTQPVNNPAAVNAALVVKEAGTYRLQAGEDQGKRKAFALSRLRAEKKPIAVYMEKLKKIKGDGVIEVRASDISPEHAAILGNTKFVMHKDRAKFLAESGRVYVGSGMPAKFFLGLAKIYSGDDPNKKIENDVYSSINDLTSDSSINRIEAALGFAREKWNKSHDIDDQSKVERLQAQTIIAQDLQEFINKVKANPQEYGFEDVTQLNKLLDMRLAQLVMANVTVIQQAVPIIGRNFKLTDGSVSYKIASSAGLDFQNETLAKHFFTFRKDNITPDNFKSPESRMELLESFQSMLRTEFDGFMEQNVTAISGLPKGLGTFLSRFDPNPKLQAEVRQVYYEALGKVLSDSKYSDIEYYYAAGRNHEEAATALAKHLQDGGATIYVHEKDSKEVAIVLVEKNKEIIKHGGTPKGVGLEIASDVKGMIQEQSNGMHWQLQEDNPKSEKYVQDEQVVASHVGIRFTGSDIRIDETRVIDLSSVAVSQLRYDTTQSAASQSAVGSEAKVTWVRAKPFAVGNEAVRHVEVPPTNNAGQVEWQRALPKQMQEAKAGAEHSAENVEPEIDRLIKRIEKCDDGIAKAIEAGGRPTVIKLHETSRENAIKEISALPGGKERYDQYEKSRGIKSASAAEEIIEVSPPPVSPGRSGS